jgi:zinc/manganese transport system permease protein
VSGPLSGLFEPGFFGNGPVHTAAIAGGVVAAVAAVVGVFTVLRSLAFAGEALGDVGTTGGSGAFLIGINPLWGFVGATLVAAGAIEAIGAKRPSGRDLATGIVLGAALGLAALFLYFDTTHSSTTGASITVLFGSLFVISSSLVPAIVLLSAVALGVTVALYRMLLLSTLSPDLAAARGVRVRLVSGLYLAAMAVAVALSALTIGAVLSTALLIGPPATALRLSKRPGLATALAAGIGVAATWIGILLAYDSYDWPPVGHGWPVSFLVVALVFTFYLLASLWSGVRTRRTDRRRGADPVPAGTREPAPAIPAERSTRAV